MSLLLTRAGGNAEASVEELADGFYYMLNSPASGDPNDINPGDWVSGPDLDNGTTNVGYDTGNQSQQSSYAFAMAAKAAGMTTDEVNLWVGYRFTGSGGDVWGAQSIAGPWEVIPFSAHSASLPHGGTFSYGQTQHTSGGPFGPYRYISCAAEDRGLTESRCGVSELDILNGGVDQGP